MTLSATIRQVYPQPGGQFRFAVRDEAQPMADYRYLWSRNAWWAALAERLIVQGRPTVTVIYDDATKELTGIARQTAKETPCSSSSS